MGIPSELFIRPLNHLLEHESWARQRLQPFAGQTVLIEGGPLRAAITIDETGRFRAAESGEPSTVTIGFGSDAPFKLLSDPGGLFASAHLTGSASLAETLAFVFRNLRWDYEADLAGLVGDIPARRMAKGLADGLAWHRSAAWKVGANIAEFATEDSGFVVPARELGEFSRAVDDLRDDLARLEKRVSRLAS